LTSNINLQGFKNEFFQPHHPQTSAPSGISFPLREGQTVEEFEADRETYEIFQEKFISQLEVLHKFAIEHLTEREAIDVTEGFELVAQRLFNPDNVNYGGCKGVLYGNGKQMLDQIVALLKDGGLPMDRCINAVAELGRQIRACPTGAAENFTLALNSLRPDGEVIPRLKEEMTTQLILEYMRDADFELHDGGMEVHFATGFMNVMAAKLGFKVQEDVHANNCGITQDHIDACECYIEARLTPLAIARALAEECLAEFSGAMQGLFENTSHSLESFNYGEMFKEVNAAIEPQKFKCGNVDADPFITRIDEDDDELWRVNTDPTLLLLKILDSDNVFTSYVNTPFRPETIFPAPGKPGFTDPGQSRIMQYKDLIWATEEGRDRLLQARHLQDVSAHRLGDIAAPALAAAIRNSSSSDLLQYLYPVAPEGTAIAATGPAATQALPWLSQTDIKQLVSKLEGETLTRFLKENMQALDRLPPVQRTDLAEAIIAKGDRADTGLITLDPSTLLAILKGPGNAVRRCFSAAMQRNDVQLVRKMGAALLNAGKDEAMPLLNRLFPQTGYHLAPSLYHAATNNMNLNTIVALGDIAIHATEQRYFSSDRLVGILSAQNINGISGWTRCVQAGQPDPLLALYRLLCLARNCNHLSPAAFFNLVSDPNHTRGAHNLLVGLHYDRTEAVTNLGYLISQAYEDGMLDMPSIEKFLACDSGDSDSDGTDLSLALAKAGTATQYAFANLLLNIDSIRRNKDRDAFRYISLPDARSDEIRAVISHLDLGWARSLGGLAALKKSAEKLFDDLKAKKRPAQEAIDVLPDLREKIARSRLGLYLIPGQMREKKESIFSDIIKITERLDRLAYSQLNRRRYNSEPASAHSALA
jgi:hypothetical protein